MSVIIKLPLFDFDRDDPIGVFAFGDIVIRLKDAEALDRLIEQCRDIKLKIMEGELEP